MSEYSPFGLGTDWPNDWEGRFALGGTKAIIRTYAINPVVAFAPIDIVSVAVGPVFQYLDFELKQRQWVDPAAAGIPIPPEELDVAFEGNVWGAGWNVGILLRVGRYLKLGTSYRSEVSHSFDSVSVDFDPDIQAISLTDTEGKADLDTPDMVFLGAS